MNESVTLSDDDFLAAFLDCSIPPGAFDHRGHLRVAWLLLQRHPLDEAVERVCDGIARLAAHLGVPGKYHRTLTEALVRLMAHGGAASAELGWEEFLRANPALVSDARGLLARHYTPERLESAEARARFVPPDRLPLPACPVRRTA
jgi:hypothetical protein